LCDKSRVEVRLLLFLLHEHLTSKRRAVNPQAGGAVDLKDIKAIIDLMRKNSIAEFELEREGFKIRLKRGAGAGTVTVGPVMYENGTSAAPLATALPPVTATAALTAKSGAPPEADIKSPMIGTFYRAPSPDAAPYVEMGTEVDADSVVCIIEAMKVMNEIKAEARGVVTQVLVENGKPVEFGQPLFKIRPT
jgi:acetyl-CoA carboxylase biotin carboxyl carrier protein